MEQRIKEIIATAIKKQKAINYKCFVEKCSESAINSHSQSLSNALKKIAEDGHLIGRKIRYFPVRNTNIDSYFQKIGINQASIFKGFCNKHDHAFFKIVDTFDLGSITKQSLARLAFRTFAYEERIKEEVLFLLDYVVKNAYDLCDDDYARYSSEGIRNHIKITRLYYLKKFIKLLDSQDCKQINGLVFVLDKLIPLSCSTMVDPTMIDAESLMQHPLERPLHLISFNLIPQDNSSIAIFTYFREQEKLLKRFIKEFQPLENIVFNHCEEILMKPSFYKSLNSELKSKIISGLAPWNSWRKEDFSGLFKTRLKSPMHV